MATCVARPAALQEKAPNGQIFGELRPFVGLEGVRVEVNGVSNVLYNVPGRFEDPARASTGLSRVELKQLDEAIRNDVADALRGRAVPVLGPTQESPDLRPRLVIDMQWGRMKSETIVNVTTTLLEAARLLKDPTRTVWAPSWSYGYRTTVSSRSLARDLRSAALGGVNNFVELYARAHAR